MKRVRGMLLIVTLAAAGCASSSAAPNAPRGDRNKITAQQLARITADNAYDAIRLLQPQWLTERGPNSINAPPASAVVFIDGSRAGDIDNLRSVLVSTVVEIRYLNSGEASNRYGLGLSRGAIEVTTKH